MTTASVKVALRIRPRQTNEERECLKVIDNTVHLGNGKSFHFDFVYPTYVTQRQVFESSIAPLLGRFIEGESATVLAYGQTGSGKSYNLGISSYSEDQGMIHQFAYSLFEQTKNFEIYASYLAVYENYVEDLIHDVSKVTIDSKTKYNDRNIWEERVYTAQDLIEILKRAKKSEQEDYFSQSHIIFSISLKHKTEGGLISRIRFVDLVGSEYDEKLHLQPGLHEKLESNLMDLDQVISCLTSSAAYYPNNQLTTLLTDDLENRSHILMLACVDTSESNYEETLNTLRHATRLYNRQEALDESEYLRAQVSRLRMQVSLLSDVQSNRDMEIQVKSLKEEMNAVRSYVRNLTDELVQIKSEKETLIFQNDNEDIQTHPIIQGYVQQVQNLKLQVAQTQMQLESALRHRPTSLLKQFSSSSSLLSKRFASASTLDLRRSISKPHRGSTSSGRRPPKRRFGSKPKVVYTPLHKARKSQPNLTDNIDEFIDRLQKEYEKSTDEIVLDDDQELSFEDFSFPSFTEQIDDNPMSPQIYPSHSETLLMNEDKLEALSVPAWSDEFKDSVTKRTSISVESMWDDTDSSITTSYVNSTIETPTISTSYKNDRKQNRKLLKMLHQSQADFLVKRELVGQLEKSEDLYTQMRSSYESKLNELKQHLLEIEKQRDVALKRNPKSPTPTGERPQSGLKLRENKQAQELRLEYEVKLKHLIAENQELRKKNTHLTQTSRTARVKADSIICQLQQDIETLTIQKKRLNRNLKIEMDSAKEASIVYEREIHQLKRKEAAALDAKNKLEEENETKSQLAKKRSEETATANAQMRQLTNTLRKAANAGTFLNEANLEKLLNGIPVATKTKRRSTIGAANPPIINLRKNESPSFV